MYFMLFCTFVIALSEAKQTYVHVPSKFTSLMLENSSGCMAETGADSEVLEKFYRCQFENNETSKKFNFCLFKNMGLSDDAGHFYVDKVLDLYENSDLKDQIAKTSTECNEIVAENPFETMYQTLLCFSAKAPVWVYARSR